jgi:hypothetical protein
MAIYLVIALQFAPSFSGRKLIASRAVPPSSINAAAFPNSSPNGDFDLCRDKSTFDRNPLKLWTLMANKSSQKHWKTRLETPSAPYSAPS